MTRTIGLSDDAYRRLAAVKQPGESFSAVVRRLTGADLLAKLVGVMDDATADHYRRVIGAKRRRDDAARRARVKRMAE